MAAFTVIREMAMLIFCMAVLLSFTQVAVAGRPVKKSAPVIEDKKSTECLDGIGVSLGGISIPSVSIGSSTPSVGSSDTPSVGSSDTPSVGSDEGTGGLDKSVPAAVHAQYVPGFDDTFVPNPGFEVPNAAGGVVP